MYAITRSGPVLAAFACAAFAAAGEPTPTGTKTGLIPRKVLFDNPDKSGAKISPDGQRLSYLAPVDGVMNVWVGPIDKPDDAKPVTQDKVRGIRSYFWAYTSQHLLYIQDKGGDENWHVYRVDLKSGATQDLTPIKGVNAQVEGVSPKFPTEILVGLNDRDPKYHDVHRVDLLSGERKLIQKNDGFAGFLTDDQFQVRFAFKFTPDGGQLALKPDGKGGWTDFMKIPMADSLTTRPAGFDKTGDVLYLVDSRARDTGAMTTLDLKTGKQALVAEDKRADAGSAIVHPTEKTIQAVSFTYDRTRWQFLDAGLKADFDTLAKVADGEITLADRTQDDKTWIVAFVMDNGPVRYYAYDRPAKKARFLFTNRKSLEGLPLQKMHTPIVKSRDDFNLVCYLTLPPGSDARGAGRPDAPVPMVLLVHGGPWARDAWGFNGYHQFLANRGYAVLSVNYRGSTGFGKRFLNAGNKEWAGKMHDDLIDAVDWAVKEKIAQPDKVAIMGGSYGGYATLAGLAFTPKAFACGESPASRTVAVSRRNSETSSQRLNMNSIP
mgnify:CR=1 FL=1